MILRHLALFVSLALSILLCSSLVQAQVLGTAVVNGQEGELPQCARTCTDVWADGVVSLTASGSTVQATHQRGSTAASVAASLCSQMTSSFPVQCSGTTANGNSATLNLVATSNIPISTSCRITVPTNVEGCLFSIGLAGYFDPSFYILSLLYAPPGNHSSNGFANTNSTGTTSSIGSNFVKGSSTGYSVSGGLLGQASAGVTFGVSAATGDTSSFQVTYSSGTGSQIQSNNQAVDHTQDQFFLWLNPQFSVGSTEVVSLPGDMTSSTAASYTVSTIAGQPMDIVNVNVAGLQNPTLIPLSVLLPQVIQPGVTLPGLAKICAHPLPPAQCTQANACGCVPSDFTSILDVDLLIGVSQTTPPSQIDANRFVLVNSPVLEGPEQQGSEPVLNSFTESDSTVQSKTETEAQTNTTSYTSSSGIDIPFLFSVKITDTTTFALTNTESQGTQNGAAHQASVTLGSSNVMCFEHVDIYEDTAYHTFAFALPAAPPTQCQ